ncbi:MAG: hypothetical protein RL115_1434 [Bacteroidota bacterium]|jgi:uncharacterized protein YydD (DUF2326 family)
MATELQLQRIQNKIQQLLKEYAVVQKENIKLKGELAALKNEVQEHEKIALELNQKISILKLNAITMTEVDKKEFEKKINAYVKEIDRCIALLGK